MGSAPKLFLHFHADKSCTSEIESRDVGLKNMVDTGNCRPENMPQGTQSISYSFEKGSKGYWPDCEMGLYARPDSCNMDQIVGGEFSLKQNWTLLVLTHLRLGNWRELEGGSHGGSWRLS